MVESDLIWPGYLGENLFLYFNPDYKLYFLDKQIRDEVLIFKQFDSKDGVAKSKCCLNVMQFIQSTKWLSDCLQGSFPDPRKGPSDNARVGFDVAVLMIYQVVLVALCWSAWTLITLTWTTVSMDWGSKTNIKSHDTSFFVNRSFHW